MSGRPRFGGNRERPHRGNHERPLMFRGAYAPMRKRAPPWFQPAWTIMAERVASAGGINLCTGRGRTPLQLASAYGAMPLCEALMAAGAGRGYVRTCTCVRACVLTNVRTYVLLNWPSLHLLAPPPPSSPQRLFYYPSRPRILRQRVYVRRYVFACVPYPPPGGPTTLTTQAFLAPA